MWVEIFRITIKYCFFRSSSSWGCELKCLACPVLSVHGRHPLREDVSWNIVFGADTHIGIGHPLREDVSWNNNCNYSTYCTCRHPLREDVSWNIVAGTMLADRIVILFVRMWVEMILYDDPSKKYTSSSSWGCELKYWKGIITAMGINVILFVRMWVEMVRQYLFGVTKAVILFVRMWVEMIMLEPAGFGDPVILFVRMWVEMLNEGDTESLKVSHPLREDVSWNSLSRSCSYPFTSSSSSWGCELKWLFPS